MAKGTTQKLDEEEEKTVNQVDIGRIWTIACAEGLRAIADPKIYLQSSLIDATLYHFWDEAVAKICVLTHGSDAKWDERSREEKEQLVAEECPEKSFEEYKNVTVGSLAAILDSVHPKSKRGQA